MVFLLEMCENQLNYALAMAHGPLAFATGRKGKIDSQFHFCRQNIYAS